MTSVRPRLPAVRRALGAAVVLFILGIAGVFYRVAPSLPTDAGPTSGSSAAGRATGGESSRVSTPTPGPKQSTTTKVSSKGQPGVTSVGIFLSAAPAADGSFEITESVILAAPTTTLQLRVPPINEGGPRFDSLHPRATTVQISAAGQPVVVPGGQVSGNLSLPLAVPTTKLALRYRLIGAAARTPGSIPGRALGALGPIVAGVPPELPVAITVRGQTVQNLQCPHLQISDQACSTRIQGGLRVKYLLPWQQSVIVVQYNMPRP